jgi:hypothetical protein
MAYQNPAEKTVLKQAQWEDSSSAEWAVVVLNHVSDSDHGAARRHGLDAAQVGSQVSGSS